MICLGIGSNLDNREMNIKKAIEMLSNNVGIKILAVSSLFETEPVGVIDQPTFLNCVISLHTILSPRELLEVCLGIEQAMGRIRTRRWGPRIIDIDILLYNTLNCNTEDLIIPHPRFVERNFVLVPLAEVLGENYIYNGKTIKQLLDQCPDTSSVVLHKHLIWESGVIEIE